MISTDLPASAFAGTEYSRERIYEMARDNATAYMVLSLAEHRGLSWESALTMLGVEMIRADNEKLERLIDIARREPYPCIALRNMIDDAAGDKGPVGT